VTSRRLRLPLLPRRPRPPPESDPESSLPLPLASLEEDGESLRRRLWRLRLRRGEPLESEAASEADGDGLRRRRDDDECRRPSLSRSRFGMSAMRGKLHRVVEAGKLYSGLICEVSYSYSLGWTVKSPSIQMAHGVKDTSGPNGPAKWN